MPAGIVEFYNGMGSPLSAKSLTIVIEQSDAVA